MPVPDTVFSVISAIDDWPSWNPDVKSAVVEGPVEQGTVFRWKAGPSSLTSTLQVVDPPREIAWTGKTMGITAIHVFSFEARDAGLAEASACMESDTPVLNYGRIAQRNSMWLMPVSTICGRRAAGR